jgi:hypothetical protein
MCTPHHAFHRPLSFRGCRSLRGKRGRGSRRRHLLDLAKKGEPEPFGPGFHTGPCSSLRCPPPAGWLAGWLATSTHYSIYQSNVPRCQPSLCPAALPSTSTSMGVLLRGFSYRPLMASMKGWLIPGGTKPLKPPVRPLSRLEIGTQHTIKYLETHSTTWLSWVGLVARKGVQEPA